ncbi:beta-galactosidase [Geofilum rubicundum JCM 15548]|uniref:Beta-galactosidase n=2 Tax=Geofilum TaxID=1236988 RepID=A0A0E9LWE0_9BACT|nr:beta-galactosidase [Geofilum rubicundum JCM 15548]
MTFLLQSKATANNPHRGAYNFNSDWKVYVGDPEGAAHTSFNDQQWEVVTLPHAWNEDEAFKLDIKDLSTGIAWYRKTFVLPEGSDDKNVFVEFEGLRQAGEFYVNGTLVGLHENGVMAVGLNLTSLLKPYPQENVIAVRTDNDWNYRERFFNQRYQWADRNFNANYGGLTKNVFLHITNKVYQTLPLYSNLGTTGVYVYASDFDIPAKKATVHVESEVRNETDRARVVNLDVVVEDLDGKEVQRFKGSPRMISPDGLSVLTASADMDNLEFWSWGYGYLYKVRARLEMDGAIVDEVPIRTGFRKTEYKDGMIYLNGRVIMLKGYAQRTSNEWPAMGMSVPAWLSDYSNQLMIESNGNFVRWMHITPWKQDVESSDRVGLIQVMPAGDAEHDVTGRRWDQRVELMRDAIIYNRNNPSILFYEGGNKGIRESHMLELLAVRDKYDPHGGRAMGSREMLASKTAEWGGEMLYINKSARKPLFANEYSRDEGLRKYWDEFTPPYHKDGDGPLYKGDDASVYNRNQDSHAIENVIRWNEYWRERPGTGKRVNSGGANIIFSDTNTHHRGEENYRRSGEVDPMRIPKDGFWAHQVMWAGWVELEDTLTHILGHWNYKKGTVKDIYVVSGAEEVELFVNGQLLGKGRQSHRFLFTFEDVCFAEGEIKAVGYNQEGLKVTEAVRQSAGKPHALQLTPMVSPAGFRADGADVALVQVEVVDAKGRRCPTALNMVNFELQGPAEWLGGIAQGPDNYILSKQLPVEGGVNRVLVRSTTEAGTIQLTAKARGLETAKLELTTLPFVTQNGLSTVLPADGLPSFIGKGPTPMTPSYRKTRIAVQPVAADAGINSEDVKQSFDDNEETSWTNDNHLDKGWVRYQLEREAELSQINIKLSGHRTRSYPIRVTVEGREVFKGSTPRNLGYVSIDFETIRGKEVMVQLIGATSYEDEYGIVEITGQKDEAVLADQEENREGSLNIVEIEFYEKAE